LLINKISRKVDRRYPEWRGYSMIKQIVKENVKTVLAENKKLISISFVALIQTIKADPQMVNLILNISSANDGEHIDNNNIIKYLQSN
jgi:hypothetical protein